MLTPKQEKFCHLIVEGHSQAEAYRRSHPNSLKWKDKTIWARASELMADSNVSGRVAELRVEAAKRHALTVDDLIAELQEARVVALAAQTPQTGSAVSATMGKAKLLGFDKTPGDSPDNPVHHAVSVTVSFIGKRQP